METEFSYSSLIKHSAPIQIVVFHNIKNKTQAQCINYFPQMKPHYRGTITIIKA